MQGKLESDKKNAQGKSHKKSEKTFSLQARLVLNIETAYNS